MPVHLFEGSMHKQRKVRQTMYLQIFVHSLDIDNIVKINPHIPAMQTLLASIMNIDINDVSIKATTTEKLGFTGRREGISAYAIALIFKE